MNSIPGSVFTGLYAVSLLVPALLAVWWGRRTRAGRPGSAERLDEVAMLASGPVQVADLVVAELLEREELRINSLGRVHATSREPAGGLGQAVAGFARTSAATLNDVRRALARHPEVRAVATRMRDRGLFLDTRRPRRAWALAAAGYAGLLSAGIWGGPSVVLPILAGAGLLACGVLSLRRRRPTATTAGRAALAEARQDTALAGGTLGAVALGGLAAHPDQAISRAARRADQNPMADAKRSARSMLRGPGGSSCSSGTFISGASCSGGAG